MTESDQPGTVAWRTRERSALLSFAERACTPDGFGWLTEDGRVDPSVAPQLWVCARMTHVFALETLIGAGFRRSRALAEHGIAALTSGPLWDTNNGGWRDGLDESGHASKSSFGHAFVLLAASSAAAAQIAGAETVLERAQDLTSRHFWSENEQWCLERYDETWCQTEPYRSANSNMHQVEAFTAAYAYTEDTTWRDRALAISERIINDQARQHGWRVPEHYDASCTPLYDYNAEQPADLLRPYGITLGHCFEWARLLVALDGCIYQSPGWLVEAASKLFDRAVSLGWRDTSEVGIPYTVDWNEQIVVDARLHWVLCEAILAADRLQRRSAHPRASILAQQWWRCLSQWFISSMPGSWHHELDAIGQPSDTICAGAPDAYHAYQALLFPDYPLVPLQGMTRLPPAAMNVAPQP